MTREKWINVTGIRSRCGWVADHAERHPHCPRHGPQSAEVQSGERSVADQVEIEEKSIDGFATRCRAAAAAPAIASVAARAATQVDDDRPCGYLAERRWPEIDLMPVEAIDPRPGVHVFGIAPLKAIRAPVLSCRKTALRLSSSIAQAWRQRVLTLIRPVVGAGKCCRTAHDTHQRSRNGGKAVSHSQLHCSKQPLRRYHGCRLVSQVEGPRGGYTGLNRQ
jgi:hypothetical protein